MLFPEKRFIFGGIIAIFAVEIIFYQKQLHPMLKKTAFFALIICSLMACTSDKPADTTDNPNETPAAIASPTNKAEDIKNNPPGKDESDLAGRLQSSVDKLAVEYQAAAKVIPELDAPSFQIVDKTKLVFSYKENGVAYERHTDLNDLATNSDNLSVIGEDGSTIKFPSLVIRTRTGEALIKTYKNGQEVAKDNEFVVTLADRKSIEKVAPLMVQMINLAHQSAAQ